MIENGIFYYSPNQFMVYRVILFCDIIDFMMMPRNLDISLMFHVGCSYLWTMIDIICCFVQHFIHGEMCDKRENHISYLVARLLVECSQRHSILHGDKCLSWGLTTYTGPDFYNHRARGCGLGIGTSYFPVRWYLRMANGSKEALNLLTTIHQSHIPKSLQRA